MQDTASHWRNFSDFPQPRVNAFRRDHLSALSWLASSIQQELLAQKKVLGSLPALAIAELLGLVWSEKENQATATLP